MIEIPDQHRRQPVVFAGLRRAGDRSPACRDEVVLLILDLDVQVGIGVAAARQEAAYSLRANNRFVQARHVSQVTGGHEIVDQLQPPVVPLPRRIVGPCAC